MSIIRYDLDAWAKALGVVSDDEAVTMLRRLQAPAEDLESGLWQLYNSVPDDYSQRTGLDDVATHFRQAAIKVNDAWQHLADVRAAFELHERGNS